MTKLIIFILALLLVGCSDNQETNRPKKSYYVPPSVNYKGQFRRGLGITIKPGGSIEEPTKFSIFRFYKTSPI